jgi:teichuronic acid biosynthesis glycosyltransferase TuaC
MRVLVVTNLTPDAASPSRGSFVRDQIQGLEDVGVDVELYSFPVGSRHYLPATREVRHLLRRERFDLVHAHYGLPGWCAVLAGARPLIVTFHGTDVRHRIVGPLSRRLARRIDLAAGASIALFGPEGGRRGLPRPPGPAAVLPCGADLERFAPIERAEARRRLALDPAGRYLLFPAAPHRPVKRHDRAEALARFLDAELLTGGDVAADRMPEWMNAANAVLVTSENEGFGLVAIEALACDVPVLSTPVGVAPFLLAGIDGCLAAPFDAEGWGSVARPHLDSDDPRIAGRRRAEWFSARLMADRVVAAYRGLLSADRSAVRPSDRGADPS